jgi:23S rRNA (adenine1618-N6)-methyltransferase
MHKRNLHRHGYKFDRLIKAQPSLETYLISSSTGDKTIDFSNAQAVLELNKALLTLHYNVAHLRLPEHALAPAIPGRADYIHHISDLIGKGDKKGLDIGCGASAIYCLLGNAIYNYEMVGVDVDDRSVEFAKKNTAKNEHIEIRNQINRSFILKGVLRKEEHFDFVMCNPPFYESEEEAIKENLKKQQNLGTRESDRNFSGLAHELWCNGGEALFIKRMIKESLAVKDQVTWFTCLLSRKQHLDKPIKQITKLKGHSIVVPMNTGNKDSRFIAWTFNEPTP